MMLETREIGPPLASDVYSVGLSSTQALSDTALASASSRGALASSYRRPRPSLAYPNTANWAFLTATQHTETPRLRPPSRPATARESAPSNCDLKVPKRPATSRSFKRQLHKPKAPLTSQGAHTAIKEAARREREQEEYVSPLLGRSVELRENASKADVLTGPFALLFRARGATAASVNATERLRIRAFQARANGEYDRAIEFYTKLTAAKTADAEAYFHLAVCLERTGQFAPALAAYEQVQALSDGPHAFAYFNMGNLCMRAEKVPQAIVYFSSAIDASQASKDRGQASLSNLTPIEFYHQRGAAYRKNGDFEKAALDYVIVHRGKGVGNWAASAGEYVGYSAEPLYKSSTPSNTGRPTNSKDIVDSEDQEAGADAENLVTEAELSRQGREDAAIDEDKAGGGLVDWALQRSLAVARLPSDERSDSDVQCLVDFMQQQFPICAALRPEVCKLLCRELVMSPNHALPADTPIFLEQDGDPTASPGDGSLFFIFQGCVTISKATGGTFQLSPQEERNERQEIQESHREGDTEERQTTTWESFCGLQPRSMSYEWQRSQLELCELNRGTVFGLQGNLTDAPRMYSAVTTETCAIGALSWRQWHRINQAQRLAEQERTAWFLTRTSIFNGLPIDEIRKLALRATPIKVVGSRAVCCEGQLVDGLLVVREGELCELSPCGLPAPPNLSVSFALSGALAVTQHQEDRAQSGRAFFAQLEAAGSPVAFQKVNEAFHGFLPQDFVSRKLRELRRLDIKTDDNGSRANMQTDPPRRRVSSQPLAKALRRGDCFCASSSWIPPRQSRLENQDGARGVACAKTALVSAATTELMFLSAADLTQTLSLPSRARLHRNLQVIAAADVVSAPQNTRRFARTKGTLASHLHLPLPGRRSNNLLEQIQRDEHWSKFKQELVQSVLRGRT